MIKMVRLKLNKIARKHNGVFISVTQDKSKIHIINMFDRDFYSLGMKDDVPNGIFHKLNEVLQEDFGIQWFLRRTKQDDLLSTYILNYC